MENSERQRFEENWKSAFENAEQRPADRVWWSIDNALTHADGGSMKRKVIFYKRLAAASVVLALALAGSTTYLISNNDNELAENANQHKNQPQTQQPNNQQEVENLNSVTTSKTKVDPTNPSGENVTGKSFANAIDNQDQFSNMNNTTQILEADKTLLGDAGQPDLRGFGLDIYDPLADRYATELHPKGRLREVTIVRKLPAMPASMMAESRRKKSPTKENLWAAVNASTGSYSANAQGDRSQSFLMTSQPSSFNNLVSASSSAKSKGNTYSVGINMGTRLAERWVLQGGVSYLNQSQGYTSNLLALDANNSRMAIVSEYTSVKQNIALSPTSTYDINSVSELVSVPLQAGYMVINRKFGLQLNSGVAADMFIRNTLTDKSGQLSSFSESAGSDSPYNTFSWSALGGTELSYKIGSQYRVSVAPGFRYALSPMLKSNSENASPIMLDLGFRFRYILK